jgi:hypothetical protein
VRSRGGAPEVGGEAGRWGPGGGERERGGREDGPAAVFGPEERPAG